MFCGHRRDRQQARSKQALPAKAVRSNGPSAAAQRQSDDQAVDMSFHMAPAGQPEQVLSQHLRAFQAVAAGDAPGDADAAAAQEADAEDRIAEALRHRTERLALLDLDDAAFAHAPS